MLVSSNQLATILNRIYPDSVFYTDSVFFPGTSYYPDSVFNSYGELSRSVSQIGSRIAESGNGEFTFLIVFSLDGERYSVPVKPGYVLFNGHSG